MPTYLVSMLSKLPFRKIGNAIAIAGVLVVAPLLAFSETTLKSIMDRWLSECSVVIDVQQKVAEPTIVRLYTFGDLPDSLPVTFSSGNGLIERVSFLNQVEQDTTNLESNVLVHPLANQRCPGDLCSDMAEPSEKLTIRIKPITPNYVYQFRVIFAQPTTSNQLKIYVKPLLDEKIGCRIETTNISNFYARQPRGFQLLLLFLFIVTLTLITGFLRSRAGEAS